MFLKIHKTEISMSFQKEKIKKGM